MNDTTKPLLTILQVSQRLAISRNSVYRIIELGQLKAIRLGKKSLRVAADDLEAFIAKSSTIQPPKE